MVAVSPQLTRRAVYNGLTPTTGQLPSGSGTLSIQWQLVRATSRGIDLSNWTSGNVTIENCLIYFSGNGSSNGAGIYRNGSGLTSVTIRNCMIINAGAPLVGPAVSSNQRGIDLTSVPNITIENVTTIDCASGIFLSTVTNLTLRYHEDHNPRGPFPRGQALQINGATGGVILIEDCSCEPVPGVAYAEDSYNLFNVTGTSVILRRLCIPFQSDGTSGRGIVVEQAGSSGVTVSDCEFTQTYNGAYSSFFNAANVSYSNMRVSGYNLYSWRGIAGSSNNGTSLCAQVVTEIASTTVAGIYEDLPAVTANGNVLGGGSWNIWFNPGGASGTVTAQAWSPTLSVIRNSFPWRATWAPPALIMKPRVGSYWLPNPNTGAAGRYANALVAGSVVTPLPGLYNYSPTTRSYVHYLDGAPVSTAWNYSIPSGSSGKTYAIGETVANSAGALAEQLSTILTIA